MVMGLGQPREVVTDNGFTHFKTYNDRFQYEYE